jgi:hypothetical protein
MLPGLIWPTQPPIQWVPVVVSLEVKRPGREADQSHPCSAEVKECVDLYLHSPNTPSWRGAQLKTGQGQLYLYLYLYKWQPLMMMMMMMMNYCVEDKTRFISTLRECIQKFPDGLPGARM